MKVALVHDYLYTYGGAERVLEALHDIWPQAPLFTAFVDWQWLMRVKPEWKGWKIISSWFDKFPGKTTLCSPLRFLAPWIWESFDLRGFDIVISSSAWFSPKGVITGPETVHICYCHTPPRYLYGLPESIGKKNWLVKTYAGLVNPFMRRWDWLASQRVDWFIANSQNVQARIKKLYQRDSIIIYPPVIKQQFKPTSLRFRGADTYYLMVNRLVWPKRVDLAILAAKKLGFKLKIVGEGKAKNELLRLAGDSKNIEFLGFVSQEKLNSLYRGCKAVLYLACQEDFGLTPVEANYAGKPVLAADQGGNRETVVDGKTGILIKDLCLAGVCRAIQDFEEKYFQRIKASDCEAQAEKFSEQVFIEKMKEFVREKIIK